MQQQPITLHNSILTYSIAGSTLYCSICRKEQATLSIFSNDRLLILDSTRMWLYYINDTNPRAFTSIPEPKTGAAYVETLKMKRESGSETIEISFVHNQEMMNWVFTFQSAKLAQKWEQLIFSQKKIIELSKQAPPPPPEPVIVGKSIIETALPEVTQHQDIVRETERNIPHDESRVERVYAAPEPEPRSNLVAANAKPIDWNHNFAQTRDMQTLFSFRQEAVQAFLGSFQGQIRSRNELSKEKNPLIRYENNLLSIQIARRYTDNARKLKKEYRNYHFIIQATISNFIVGVPLACLIQLQDIVGLVKAQFPQNAPQVSMIPAQLQPLERYTRIKNRVMQQCKILDLSEHYQATNTGKIFFFDELYEYLPVNMEFTGNDLTLIRPEFMLDSVEHYITTSNMNTSQGRAESRQIRELALLLTDKAKDFSSQFYQKDFPVVRFSQLKNIIHESGLNLKYLPNIYSHCGNSYVKKYLYTAMASKVVKEYVNENVVAIRATDRNQPYERIMEDVMGWLLSGSNNKSNDLWKEIALLFKRKYNISLSHQELLPKFFFMSLMELLPADYDISKINSEKLIFKDRNIIERGFVRQALPKVKSYQRFLPAHIEQLREQSKVERTQEFAQKVLGVFYKGGSREPCYSIGRNEEWMSNYLSYYYPPVKIASDSDDRVHGLYDAVNAEPPSFFSLQLTVNYLNWCNKRNKHNEFQACFDEAYPILDFWIDEPHPIKAEFLEALSNNKSILGQNKEMIRYMKESLDICMKFWGLEHVETGSKLFELAESFLKAGNKKEATHYFLKARDNIQNNKTVTSLLGKSLVRLASISLSELEYEQAVDYAKESIKRIEDHERKVNSSGITFASTKMKAFQILSRVYEICNRTAEYRDLALAVSKRFNGSLDVQIYQQMVRICLASAVYRAHNQRCESFIDLCKRLQQERREDAGVERLMYLSRDSTVMEKFLYKFDQFDRFLFEDKGKKKPLTAEMNEFLDISACILRMVGFGYIRQLAEQRMISSM